MAVGPSAGGKLPEWQVEHWLATGACPWFQLVGFHPLVAWQLVQFRLVGIWAAVLPVAVLPLWQLAQLVALVNPAWSMPDAGNQPDVLWQVSQEAVVWM